MNIRVNLGPRISKKGVFFFYFSDILEKRIVFLNNDENNSSDNLYQHSDNLYQHSDKEKHIVWLLAIDFSKI